MTASRQKTLLTGALLYDGSALPPRRCDVLVVGETIARVGRAARDEADRVIDLGGLALAPGFIDVHAHSDFSLLRWPEAEGKVLQGITTEISGNCGLSAAPMRGAARAQREPDLREYGINERWETFDEYFALLQGAAPVPNVATLAGHGSIRASVMGYEDRQPTDAEQSHMARLLREALDHGAIGLSAGLIYPPGVYASTEELIALVHAGLAHARSRGWDFLYAAHMRSEGDALIEAIDETLRIGRATGAPVHISHLKTAGRANWGKIDRAVETIERARIEGLAVTADRYPYTAGSTDLDAVLPRWTYEGGSAEELKRLVDPASRARIVRELGAEGVDWHAIQIASVEGERNRACEGMRMDEAAAGRGMPPAEFLITLLLEESLRVGAIFHSMSEENLRRFLSLPNLMPGTDATARPLGARGKPHPRGFGSYPRFLAEYACDLSAAVYKATALPARTFGLRGRGEVREGYCADLVAFDPLKVRDCATYEDPCRAPEGIAYVVVGGRVVACEGRMTGERPGRVLRHGVRGGRAACAAGSV
jgi:N-acyl-D-aspartate/D-glutamate deacylase